MIRKHSSAPLPTERRRTPERRHPTERRRTPERRRSLLATCAVLALSASGLLPLPAAAQELKPLTLDDYPSWSRVTEVGLSPDGRWMTFAYAPNEGDVRFFFRELSRPGAPPADSALNGAGAVFSEDSRWLAFLTAPPEAEAERPREQRRPLPRTLHLVELRSGARSQVENAATFAFSKNSLWLAVHKARQGAGAGGAQPQAAGRGGAGATAAGASGTEEPRGADLVLKELATGTVTSLGNVAEFAFNEEGTHLAYLVDAQGRAGNGLYLMALGTGRIVPLHTGDHLYAGLAWDKAGRSLAVLRGAKPEGKVQRENILLAFPAVTASPGQGSSSDREAGGSGGSPLVSYDPAADPSFPAGFVLSEFQELRWSEDGGRIFLGIRAQEEEVERGRVPRANVDVWHWRDDRVQSVQMVQAGRDRRSADLAVLNLEGPRFLRLADDALRRVQLTDDGRWAVGFDDSPYRRDRDHPENRSDAYRLDPATGERRLVARALIHSMGLSPDSRWFLFWQERRVRAFRLEDGVTLDLTERAGVDFENAEFDRPVEKPAYGVGGWSTDGQWVFLNTRYDVWQVSLARDEARNLTGGTGEREEIRFRLMDLNTEDRGVDLSEPLLLSAYGEWTKRSGYFRARPGRDPEPLLWEDAMLGTPGFRGAGLQKATGADRVLFTRQTFRDFPDHWASDARFRSPVRVTHANPQQAEYAWGSRVLVDYTNGRGHRLQATLALPAGYEEGRRYPMIVYFYEKMSQRHHEYSLPVYDDRPHMSTYASNGYLVLMPDIVYDMGYPGSSALDDVVSAARAAIAAGYADPERLCLQGHSWGGYESSFILTQTGMFACVVTGAPLTNLVSMHNILYKQSGNPNAALIEWGQGRMDTTPFHDLERYVSQSPVHHVGKITTPFLILHGTADGAVDWNQGLEYYIAARRMGKEVILLSYPDEPHHLARREDQKDFQVRMTQYFDHYLKDAPAPRWLAEGVPFLQKERVGPKEMPGS